MKNFYSFFFVMVAAIITTNSFSQNTFPSNGAVGIGTTSPAKSSLLEVKSTTKGVLIPRMTQTQRNAIATPATGLIVYQTDATPGLYTYSGIAWTAVTPKSKGWSLTGNANTNTSKNFLGTTDAQPLMFKVDNTKAGYIDYDWEKANTSFGYQILISNTTGNNNTAEGYRALVSNTTGNGNTANGVNALFYNTTGGGNTAIGSGTLTINSTGFWNTATGNLALYDNRTGSYNSAFGSSALHYTTTSQYNTAIGYNAGGAYDNGYNNVFLGANVDVTGAGFYNVIAIGQGTICTDNSQVTMGNSSTATYRAYADWSNISDGRFKKNIKENVPGLEFINKLQPITYTLDATGIDNFLHQSQPQDKQASGQAKVWMSKALAAKEKTIFTGFVAQDVEKAAKSLNYNFSGVDAAKNDKDVYGLRYAEFVVPLVKAVQELSKMNDEKAAAIKDMKSEIISLKSEMEQLKAMMVSNKSTVNGQQSTVISSASLQQNIPNPFQNSTTINYNLPQQYSSAKIIVTDKSGKVLKEINLPAGRQGISGTGKGSVNIDAATLSSGAYQYSLIVDGKLIDTKQMVLAK